MTESDGSTKDVSDQDTNTEPTFSPPPTDLPEPDLTPEQKELIVVAEQLFEQMCLDRHRAGNQKYGKFTFLEMPTVQMAMEEVVDLANYARYTFIKLALLQDAIRQVQNNSLLGGEAEGFHTMEEILGLKKEI
jgi:hypothetical protein